MVAVPECVVVRAALRTACLCFVVLAALVLPARARTTTVRVVAVTPGRSADVVIDQKEPLTIEVGRTIEGVRVLRVDATGAVISVDGTTKLFPLVSGGSRGHATGTGSVTLAADPSGHFVTAGAINGKPVTFIVDTGATSVALSSAEATRIGVSYQNGTAMVGMTANGPVRGWRVMLTSVRIGDVTVSNVEGVVLDAKLGPVLLGMSFLERFDMIRQGSTLVLRRSAR